MVDEPLPAQPLDTRSPRETRRCAPPDGGPVAALGDAQRWTIRGSVRTQLADRMRSMSDEAGSFDGRVISVAVDQLADLNAQLGREGADRALVELAQRLERALGAQATVGDLGGGLLLAVAAPGADGSRPVEELQQRLAAEVAVSGATVTLRCHVAEVDLRSSRTRTLADALEVIGRCERWARLGGLGSNGGTPLASVGPGDAALAAVSRAVDAGAIELRYQPVVDLRSGAVVGAEALARWPLAPSGFEAPQHFLLLAAVAGRQREVTDHILDQVCATAARGSIERSGIWLSANLSATEAVGTDTAARALAAVERHRVLPDRLILELSERIVPDLATQRSIIGLHRAGLRVAIDDFGTGWSSLAQLTDLPVEIVKLDQSVVELTRSGGAPLLDASVAIAEALGLRVLAEGIETPDDLAAVRAAGVHLGQGYLLGSPMPAEELEGVLRPVEA